VAASSSKPFGCSTTIQSCLISGRGVRQPGEGAVGLFVLAYNLAVLVDDTSPIALANNGRIGADGRDAASVASERRHFFVRLTPPPKSDAKSRATRLGGIPAGSLEVTWED
jgi:hypothetical protein